jgi:hypothetical protein
MSYVHTFKQNSSGVFVPFVRGEDRTLQQVAAAPQYGPQYAFLCAPEREVGICGPRGTGKTDVLLLDFLSGVGRGFGSQYKGVIVRPSQREFTDLIKLSEDRIKPVWGDAASFNKLKNFWEWRTGETLEFSYFDRPDQFGLYQGKQYVFIGFEELQLFDDFKCYLMLFSCLRSPIPEDVLPRKIRFSANPSGPSHNKIKHRFNLHGVPQGMCGPVIEDVGEDGKIARRRMIYSDFADNVLLKRTEPDYMRTIETACEGDSARREAWTKGNWDVISGGFFDEIFYQHARTINEPDFDPPDGGHYFFAYDHGGTAPACFLFFWENTDGADVMFKDGKVRSGRRGDIHIIGEIYFYTGQPNEGTNSSVADMLRVFTEYKIRRGWRFRDPVTGKWSDIMRRGCADTSIWDDSNERGSIAEEFELPIIIEAVKHPGVRFDRATKGPNSIAIGGALMRERFIATAPAKDSKIRQGKGLFVVESECPQFLRTIPVLARDKRFPDKIAENSENHLFDCCRYGLNYDLTPAFSTRRRQIW